MCSPLLKFGGEGNFAAYETEFVRLYMVRNIVVRDVLGHEVRFEKASAHHVCFKSGDAVWNHGPRTEWNQRRAERISWIGRTLSDPLEIRPTIQVKPGQKFPKAMRYLRTFDSEADRDAEDEFGLYSVIVEREGVGVVRFRTGYWLDPNDWKSYRKIGPPIYSRAKGLLVPTNWVNQRGK
jgi:hypothetical protein